eukprot:TRINITY_DN2762_c2_g1_i2.p2 TRINITY_DN2762_c2_g1~~TRINITY_DN2762_c2_g1_i2.p2  ORF type:complete len:111 (+),score=19.23 TRINITY_DN2762_c2_g1_i2:95-427(+)
MPFLTIVGAPELFETQGVKAWQVRQGAPLGTAAQLACLRRLLKVDDRGGDDLPGYEIRRDHAGGALLRLSEPPETLGLSRGGAGVDPAARRRPPRRRGRPRRRRAASAAA